LNEYTANSFVNGNLVKDYEEKQEYKEKEIINPLKLKPYDNNNSNNQLEKEKIS